MRPEGISRVHRQGCKSHWPSNYPQKNQPLFWWVALWGIGNSSSSHPRSCSPSRNHCSQFSFGPHQIVSIFCFLSLSFYSVYPPALRGIFLCCFSRAYSLSHGTFSPCPSLHGSLSARGGFSATAFWRGAAFPPRLLVQVVPAAFRRTWAPATTFRHARAPADVAEHRHERL